MSGPKIVSLNGEEIPEPGTPNENVIQILERTLEAAKSGRVSGIVLVINDADIYEWYVSGSGLYSYTALGAVHSVAHKIAESINEDTQEC